MKEREENQRLNAELDGFLQEAVDSFPGGGIGFENDPVFEDDD